MEWILGIFSGISSIFSGKAKNYKEKIEKLRTLLDELEKGCVSIIKVENDNELIFRAQGYLKKDKNGPCPYFNYDLLNPIERLVNELEEIRKSLWYKFLKKVKYIS